MQEEIHTTYPQWRQRYPTVSGLAREPTRSATSAKSLHSARHIVVLGAGGKPGLADARTTTTLCALRCLPKVTPRSTLVIAEVQLEQSVPSEAGGWLDRAPPERRLDGAVLRGARGRHGDGAVCPRRGA